MKPQKFKDRHGMFDECQFCIARYIRKDNPCDVSVRCNSCPHFIDATLIDPFIIHCLWERENVERFIASLSVMNSAD